MMVHVMVMVMVMVMVVVVVIVMVQVVVGKDREEVRPGAFCKSAPRR